MSVLDKALETFKANPTAENVWALQIAMVEYQKGWHQPATEQCTEKARKAVALKTRKGGKRDANRNYITNMKEFRSTEHAIRYSKQHSTIAFLVVPDLTTAIADAEALGYEVDYAEINKDPHDNRDTYDFFGMEDPESDDQDWRLTIKVELQD